jgi:hypothetical protein
MEYMILIHSDENFPMPAPTDPGFDEMMAGWSAYNQKLIDGGHFIAGASLLPTSTATIVTKSFGVAATISDGPFAETKEQLGGFYMISAADLDEAIALTTEIPIPVASLEIRPVAVRPDAVRAEAGAVAASAG